MSRNGQIWADGVQFIQTLTWISTATTTSTTNSGAYPYTLYVYIYVYVHESIDSTAKNKQQHTTACTKPRQMQQVRVPGLDLTIDIHPVLQAPSRKLQLWAQSLTEPWAESWRDPPPPGPGPPHPAPALTPSLAQISGDPAWLTQGTLPPPPPPYTLLCLATDATAQFKILHDFLE